MLRSWCFVRGFLKSGLLAKIERFEDIEGWQNTVIRSWCFVRRFLKSEPLAKIERFEDIEGWQDTVRRAGRLRHTG